jgi:HD superfamily phosphohydrolase
MVDKKAKQLNLINEKSTPSVKQDISCPLYAGETTEEERQEFFLPISGFIWLFPEEVEVVNHPIFQRLGNVYQLGQTFLVYRGGTHKRIEHVLGTVHMVHRMISAVRYNYKKSLKNRKALAAQISNNEERFIRLGALLHDIGHVAAGHTLEDELCIIGKHDHDERLDRLFFNNDTRWVDSHGRTLSNLLDTEFECYIPTSLQGKISVTDICRLLIRKHPDEKRDKYLTQRRILQESNDIRMSVCRDMIGNTICADILDYLYRDWYHLGKPKTFDERILQYMEIVSLDKDIAQRQPPKQSNNDVIVISLGRNPKIRTDAISSILDLLESRYHLAESALFHKTKLAASAMLDRALFELWEGGSDNIEEFILPLSDEQLITECNKLALEAGKTISHEILTCLEKRYLYSTFLVYSYSDLKDEVRNKIQKIYVKNNDAPNLPARNRSNALRLLENDLDLPPGSIVMHCPSHKMNAKIAEVRIAVNDDIAKFCEYEEKKENLLSGGHLDAQIKRFTRLWKIHFFIRKNVRSQIKEKIHLLRLAIDKLIIGNLLYGEKMNDCSHSIASQLISDTSSELYGKQLINQNSMLERAAHRDSEVEFLEYPSGALSIKSCADSTNDENK